MFRTNTSELPAEVHLHILKNLGLFNKNMANVARVCHFANDAIGFLSTRPELILEELSKMTRGERLVAAMKSEIAAQYMLTHFVNDLGGFNAYSLMVYNQSSAKSEGSLKFITGKYFVEIADTFPALRPYILEHYSNKLHPESLKRLTELELQTRLNKIPTMPMS